MALEHSRDVRSRAVKHELQPVFDELGRGGGLWGSEQRWRGSRSAGDRHVIGGGVVLKREEVEWTADEAKLSEGRG